MVWVKDHTKVHFQLNNPTARVFQWVSILEGHTILYAQHLMYTSETWNNQRP